MSNPIRISRVHCGVCFGLSHRRERPRCSGCSRPYADEQVKRTEPRSASAIAEFEES